MTELIVTLDDSAPVNIIKKAISLLKGVQKVATFNHIVMSERQSEQIARLKELASLKHDWDGEGALPIDKIVLKNAKSLIMKSSDDVLSSWTFFPEVNGTVLFQKNDNNACVSIEKNDFSAVNGKASMSVQPFSIDKIISFIS